jgi:hypothetical protein
MGGNVMSNKIVLSRIDNYTHSELFDTSTAWNRILTLIFEDVVNLDDEDLTNLVYDIVSDPTTSAKEDVIELLKNEHIGSMFILEYN